MLEALLDSDDRRAVFRAHDRERQQTVAVSIWHESIASDAGGRGRFGRAAELLALVDHPNLARIVDHGTSGRLAYLVHEWLDGESLAARLRHSPLTKDDAFAMVLQLLAAVAAAHSRGLAHGNLRPSKLILQKRVHAGDSIKVLDLGLPKLTAALLPGATARTSAGVLRALGGGEVLHYAAPECREGQAPDPRSDVYAVGVLLSELLLREATGTAGVEGEGESNVDLVVSAESGIIAGARAAVAEHEPAPESGVIAGGRAAAAEGQQLGVAGAFAAQQPSAAEAPERSGDSARAFAPSPPPASPPAADGGEEARPVAAEVATASDASAADGLRSLSVNGAFGVDVERVSEQLERGTGAFADADLARSAPRVWGGDGGARERTGTLHGVGPDAIRVLGANAALAPDASAAAAGSPEPAAADGGANGTPANHAHVRAVPPGSELVSVEVVLDPALEALLDRARAHNPNERFSSAADMLGALVDTFPRGLSEPQEPLADDGDMFAEVTTVYQPSQMFTVDAKKQSKERADATARPTLEVERLRSPSAEHPTDVRPSLAAGMLVLMVVGVMGAMWLSSRNNSAPKPPDSVRSVALAPKEAPNPPPISQETTTSAAKSEGALVESPATPDMAAPPPAAAPEQSASTPPPSAASANDAPTETSAAPAGDQPEFEVIDDEAVKAAAQTKLPAARSAGTAPARNPWLAELPPELQPIRAKVASGVDIDDPALRTLHAWNHRNPKDVRGHLLLGRAYLKRYWRSDGLAELATALRIDPSARGAPEVLPLLIHLVIEGKVVDTASELIARSYGDEALDAIEDAISKTKNPAATQRLHVLHGRLLAAL